MNLFLIEEKKRFIMLTQIHAVHFTADAKLVEMVEEKVKKLEHFHPKIESVDVYLKLENNHAKIKEKVVEIKVGIPGHKLFCMNKGETFETAFLHALESASELVKKKKETN
jgi:putative sigma-54 modulation protein